MRDGVLSGKRIYLQPGNTARKKLERAFDNVFAHTIEEFYQAIIKSSKNSYKVPIFYANNVFNTMNQEQLGNSLKLISDILKPEGTLIITADLSPEIGNLVTILIEKYPNYWPILIVSENQEWYHQRAKITLIPKKNIPAIKSLLDIFKVYLGDPEKLKDNPHIIMARENKENWQIIDVEEFYTDILINEIILCITCANNGYLISP